MRCLAKPNKALGFAIVSAAFLFAHGSWANYSLNTQWQRTQAADIKSGLGTEFSLSEIAIGGDFYHWQKNLSSLLWAPMLPVQISHGAAVDCQR